MKKENMKKDYIKPAIQVYEFQDECPLLSSSDGYEALEDVDGWPYGGGGDQPGR